MLVTLGRTGLRVKKLGFGGIPIQRVNESRAVGVVRHAVEKGVDFIDTSRAYSNSEERIGLALNGVKKPVVLASKSVDRTADGIRRDLEISLEKLRKDFIHIYQCHFVHEEDYSGIISPGGALEGLRRAKEQGKIAHTGITSHSLPLLERIVRDGFFDLIMVCFNFMEAEAGERIIPYALSRDIGVIAMKPLAGGVIDRPGPALKYALSREGVLVLCGVEREDLFDENWAVYQGAPSSMRKTTASYGRFAKPTGKASVTGVTIASRAPRGSTYRTCWESAPRSNVWGRAFSPPLPASATSRRPGTAPGAGNARSAVHMIFPSPT